MPAIIKYNSSGRCRDQHAGSGGVGRICFDCQIAGNVQRSRRCHLESGDAGKQSIITRIGDNTTARQFNLAATITEIGNTAIHQFDFGLAVHHYRLRENACTAIGQGNGRCIRQNRVIKFSFAVLLHEKFSLIRQRQGVCLQQSIPAARPAHFRLAASGGAVDCQGPGNYHTCIATAVAQY